MASLSKTTYLMGIQCPKLLWYRYNAKEQIPEPDEAQQAVFDQGHEVGAWAKKLFPGGIEIAEGIVELDEVVRRTREALPQRKPLFEAAFGTETCYARADILVPVGTDQWDIVEVKSSTSVKAINLHDLAFQLHVYAAAGLKIRQSFLLHLNSDYVRRGEIDPGQLFTKADLTEQIRPLVPAIKAKVSELRAIIEQPEHPRIRIGKHCGDPYYCPLIDTCWAFLPAHSVMELYSGKQRGFRLVNEGITEITAIPDSEPLTERQLIQRRVLQSGRTHVDQRALTSFLGQLRHPLSFLDFETFSSAVPLIDDCRPYEQVPFQYSLHVVKQTGATPEHWKFLATDRQDPRPEFMRRLQEDLPDRGSVIVYNAAFEKGRIERCCELLPQYTSWWKSVEGRIVDLLAPFRAFDYYHPDQSGSASIKAVLPVLTGGGYGGMAIQDGGTASRRYLSAVYGDLPPAEQRQVYTDLDAYCGLDTMGMVRIEEALRKLAG
jgi:Domain of unknown function(DUF2779)